MHELSLATGVVETVVRHAGGERVISVQMKIGTLRQVVPSSLEFYFGICSRGTRCEAAALEQEIIAAELGCRDCNEQWKLVALEFRCPRCGSTDIDVLRGTELWIESIEVEDDLGAAGEREEEPSIAPR